MFFRQLSLLALAVLPSSLAQVSDDFESGWDQTKWPIYAPDCNQGGTVSLDSTSAHSGKNSMKVTSPGGYCGHIFFGTTKVPSGDVYVRAWLKATTALTSSHVSFITMPDSAQPAGKHLRIGGQNQILMYNRESDDATLPDLSPQGSATSVALPAGSWQCFEYHLGTDGSIETWLNSAAIPGLTTANNPNAQGWSRSTIKPKITGVYFGWESYSGDPNTFWYDDISVGSSRIGCGSGSAATTSVQVSRTTTSTTSKLPTTVTTSSRVPATTTTLATFTSSAIPTTARTTTKTVPTPTPATTSSTRTSTAVVSGGIIPQWGQCGGMGWSGSGSCAAGSTCKYSNEWYSQCL